MVIIRKVLLFGCKSSAHVSPSSVWFARSDFPCLCRYPRTLGRVLPGVVGWGLMCVLSTPFFFSSSSSSSPPSLSFVDTVFVPLRLYLMAPYFLLLYKWNMNEVITVAGCDCAFNFENFTVCPSYYHSNIYIVNLLLWMYDHECPWHHASFHVYVHFMWYVAIKIYRLIEDQPSCLKGRERAVVNQTNAGTVSKATSWGNFRERQDGPQNYGLFRAHRYRLQLNSTELIPLAGTGWRDVLSQKQIPPFL